MSEPKKWVGYADLLEAKRKREEREGQEEARIDTQTELQIPAPDIEQPSLSHPTPIEPVADIDKKEQDRRSTPVITPVTTTVPTLVETLAHTPVEPPIAENTREENTTQSQYLDATHTGSEQRIYSVMYRETVSKGIRERHFGPSELIRKTGIRSDRTIRTAVRGLIQKLSIEMVSNINGNPLGPRYRIYDPKEIIRRRRTAGIKIDPQSKKVVSIETATPVVTPVVTPVTTAPPTEAATGDKIYRGTTAETTPVTPAISTGVSKYRNYDDRVEATTASSSSKSSDKNSDDDNTFLDSLRDIYERATGNSWTTTDAVTAQKGRDIPLEVWGIAICFCMDRAPGHKFDRLAYVLEEARHHQEEMGSFSHEDLRLIMRHSLRQLERARSSGMWEPVATEKGSE